MQVCGQRALHFEEEAILSNAAEFVSGVRLPADDSARDDESDSAVSTILLPHDTSP